MWYPLLIHLHRLHIVLKMRMTIWKMVMFNILFFTYYITLILLLIVLLIIFHLNLQRVEVFLL